MTAPPLTPADVKFHAEAAVIYGCLGKGDKYILVPFDDDAAFGRALHDARVHGFYYCGLLGLTKDCDPLVLCEPDPDCIVVMARAAAGFIRQHAQRFVPEIGDSVDWLAGLHALEDPRNQV